MQHPENSRVPHQLYLPPPTTVLVVYQPMYIVSHLPVSYTTPLLLPPPLPQQQVIEAEEDEDEIEVGNTFLEEIKDRSLASWRPQRGVNRRALLFLCVVLPCLIGLLIAAGTALTAPITHHGAVRPVLPHPKTVPRVVPTHGSPASVLNGASKALLRIDGSDPKQYLTQTDYATWWPSACSPASMTEVINSYGHHYRIADILKVEVALGVITPQNGLLRPSGIDQTVAQFGFQAHWLNTPSLEILIQIANGGTPVIVNFPPSRWQGGHFLVVTGGDKNMVYLADSSKLNMRALDHQTFLRYWVGLAVVVTPAPSAYSVIGSPTLTVDFMNRVLQAGGSPAAGKAQALYDLGVKYGIDPAFALAFYQHESGFGTRGEAQATNSLGNLRCIPNAACVNTAGQACQANQSCYAAFPTLEAGFEAWFRLIRNLYVNSWGLTTIDQIIPRYAPPSDNNNDDAYIGSLKHELDTWHAGQISA